ncbi:Uncharacterised protein [Serratia entomophila]|nr:Uncharacterised protein [Serratia entomophila]CAI1761789.1 Uncharacterised protein [Serratia entomophila]
MPIIFRRYKRSSTGKIMNSHDYGYAAWPLKVNEPTRKHPSPASLKGKKW